MKRSITNIKINTQTINNKRKQKIIKSTNHANQQNTINNHQKSNNKHHTILTNVHKINDIAENRTKNNNTQDTNNNTKCQTADNTKPKRRTNEHSTTHIILNRQKTLKNNSNITIKQQ